MILPILSAAQVAEAVYDESAFRYQDRKHLLPSSRVSQSDIIGAVVSTILRNVGSISSDHQIRGALNDVQRCLGPKRGEF